MTDLTDEELKQKIQKRLNDKGMQLDPDSCITVLKKCKYEKYLPRTIEERWILQQMKEAGILKISMVYTMHPGFDDATVKETDGSERDT